MLGEFCTNESKRLLMKDLQNDDGRLWAARTQGAGELWLAWLTALVQLDDNGSYSCTSVFW